MKKCPYCDFIGTQDEVDEHLVYMMTVAKDKEHSGEDD